jgi:phage-related protein
MLLPLLVCASYGRNDDYGGGSSASKVKANKAEPVVHVGGNAAEGADVQQWDAGNARVVAQDFDAYDTFAAVVQSVKHAVQHMFSAVGGLFSSFFKTVSQAVVDVLSTGYLWLNDNVFRVIHDVVLQVYLQVKGTWEAIGHCLLRTWSMLSGWFSAIARAVLSTLSSMKHAVQHMFSTLGGLFSSFFKTVSGVVVDVLSTGCHWLNDNVFRVIHDVVLQVYLQVKGTWEAIGHCLLRTWSMLSGWFSAIARAVLSTLSAVKHAVQHMFSTLGGLFSSFFKTVSGVVVDVLSTGCHWLNDNVFRVIHDVVLQVYLQVKGTWEAIGHCLLRTWSLLSGWFSAIARAVLSTLSSMKHAVQHMFSTLGGLFSSFFKTVSGVVVDVLSTGCHWLNDNVFRVIHDVEMQRALKSEVTQRVVQRGTAGFVQMPR